MRPTRRPSSAPRPSPGWRARSARRFDPSRSINFSRGSEQKLHQDIGRVPHRTCELSRRPRGSPLEDVAPGSGPLVFHPGSHHSATFEELTTTGRRTSGPLTTPASPDTTTGSPTRRRRFPRNASSGAKGQVLFWHGMLFHGGSPIADPASTRRSMVVHFASPLSDRGGQSAARSGGRSVLSGVSHPWSEWPMP